jgi:hypothetical protein
MAPLTSCARLVGDTLCMFFRPDQARDIFSACRDNDERLVFVGKVYNLKNVIYALAFWKNIQ